MPVFSPEHCETAEELLGREHALLGSYCLCPYAPDLTHLEEEEATESEAKDEETSGRCLTPREVCSVPGLLVEA